ncbi:MAG TPA: DUF3551 domain-containing protein [Bradyrhizobium sp.]|nr:DUF3551 domain-containing protein [Bradyrhizobium sp.]
MRISLVFALGLGIAGLCTVASKPARAFDYPWCLASGSGGWDCSFSTFAQCQVSASGVGSCLQNPRAALSPDPAGANSPGRRRGQ